ncbi:MAG: hypothetical protein A2521_02705 [Deltaproteobacteria bacterium RIFOXYD12_FULL_57_12]|nr:MAG: hypothetical protein A2521_02705 [Deltaproteobacteria bacterium RIFOXYD12_FULL_57_12]
MRLNKLRTLLLLFLAATLLVGMGMGRAVAATAAEAGPAMAADSSYVIGAGDLLAISVWKNADLTGLVPVLPDNTISFPLVGELVAGGRTVGQLQEELARRLAQFVTDPVLSVVVREVRSLMVYVIGKVNKPGRFELNGNITVLQGLALAGGLNPFAERNEIKVFRVEGGSEVIPFRYDDVAEGGSLAQNILLRRGDTIVVP